MESLSTFKAQTHFNSAFQNHANRKPPYLYSHMYAIMHTVSSYTNKGKILKTIYYNALYFTM
jgi:hypothetical protein